VVAGVGSLAGAGAEAAASSGGGTRGLGAAGAAVVAAGGARGAGAAGLGGFGVGMRGVVFYRRKRRERRGDKLGSVFSVRSC